MTSHSWPWPSVTMSPGRGWWGKTLAGWVMPSLFLWAGRIPEATLAVRRSVRPAVGGLGCRGDSANQQKSGTAQDREATHRRLSLVHEGPRADSERPGELDDGCERRLAEPPLQHPDIGL
jgi:hypothetical protein